MLPDELKALDHKKSLDQFTDKCRSRDVLNELPDRIFLAQPISTADHDHLVMILHIKTVITTNYDTLFEKAYGERANLIWLDEHVGRWDDKKINIIKSTGI